MSDEYLMYDTLSIENTNQATKKPRPVSLIWTQDIFVIQRTALPTEVVQARTRVKSDLSIAEKQPKKATIQDADLNGTVSPSSYSMLGSKVDNFIKNSQSISFMTGIDSRSSKPNKSTAGVPYRNMPPSKIIQKTPAQVYREEMKKTLMRLDRAEADKSRLFNNTIGSIPQSSIQKSNELKERIMQLRESYSKQDSPAEPKRGSSILDKSRVIHYTAQN
jgi:hypothetical protein